MRKKKSSSSGSHSSEESRDLPLRAVANQPLRGRTQDQRSLGEIPRAAGLGGPPGNWQDSSFRYGGFFPWVQAMAPPTGAILPPARWPGTSSHTAVWSIVCWKEKYPKPWISACREPQANGTNFQVSQRLEVIPSEVNILPTAKRWRLYRRRGIRKQELSRGGIIKALPLKERGRQEWERRGQATKGRTRKGKERTSQKGKIRGTQEGILRPTYKRGCPRTGYGSTWEEWKDWCDHAGTFP